MEEKSYKKLDIWQWISLSIDDMTTLINSSLINSTIYHMSMFLLQGGSIKKKIPSGAMEENM
jgi:hypothetical protein